MKISGLVIFIFFVLVETLFNPANSWAKTINGFNLENSLIDQDTILPGGPDRDGIPSIDAPKFLSAKEAMKAFGETDRAIALEIGGEAKLYPLDILNWHEVVNDSIAGRPVLVTYCPLTDTGIVFDPRINDKTIKFGVSGLLHQGNLIMYDRSTESLWTQLGMKGITGTHKGKTLPQIPSKIITLGAYLKNNPKAKVLSKDTGHTRLYNIDPYFRYRTNDKLFFPVKPLDRSQPIKAWSVLIHTPGEKITAPLKNGKPNESTELKAGGSKVRLMFTEEQRTLQCESADPELFCIGGYWFALRAFYPESKVHNLK